MKFLAGENSNFLFRSLSLCTLLSCLLPIGLSLAYEAPKLPVVPDVQCAFPANLGKEEALAHLLKVKLLCEKWSKSIETTEENAVIDISKWTQRMVDMLFASVTHLAANIKCENSNLRSLPMDSIETITNVSVTIVNNRFLSKITLQPDVTLLNAKLVIMNNPMLTGNFLAVHGGKFDYVQKPQSCSPSMEGAAMKSFKDIAECPNIYGDLIIDDTTVVDDNAYATIITSFAQGCIRITNKKLQNLEFLKLPENTQIKPKCYGGSKGLPSPSLTSAIHPHAMAGQMTVKTDGSTFVTPSFIFGKQLIDVNIEPSWEHEKTRERLEHIALSSNNFSVAHSIGFFKNDRDSECGEGKFNKKKCPVYYDDLTLDGCTEGDIAPYVDLVKVHGHLKITNCKAGTVSFPHLEKIMGDLDVSENSELVVLDLPKLIYVHKIHPVNNYKMETGIDSQVNLIRAIQNPTNAEELGVAAEVGAVGAVGNSAYISTYVFSMFTIVAAVLV